MPHLDLSPVKPVLPIAPYIGGKRNLAGRLVRIINQVPHTLYAEPFVGMAGVFLRRTSKPKAEVINDWSADIANLFRVAQRHPEALQREIRYQLTTRVDFDRLGRVDPTTLTDIERAARFLYLQRTAFGGKVTGRNFAMPRDGRPARFDPSRLTAMLDALHDRLGGVAIEQLPWARFIDRYDTSGTLFYIDPPYYGCEDDYGAQLFNRDQFGQMAEQLGQLKGRFILSINDRPEVRAIFDRFKQIPIATTYTLASAGAQQARELVITNSDEALAAAGG